MASLFSGIRPYSAVLTLRAKLNVAVSPTVTSSTRQVVGEPGPKPLFASVVADDRRQSIDALVSVCAPQSDFCKADLDAKRIIPLSLELIEASAGLLKMKC